MRNADTTAADVLATALEGGIGYWSLASEIVYDNSEDVTYLGVTLHEYEDDESKHNENDCIVQQTIFGNNYYQLAGHAITLADVKAAINRIAFDTAREIEYLGMTTRCVCRDLLFNPDEADFDSSDADEIIQVACFGKVVYG